MPIQTGKINSEVTARRSQVWTTTRYVEIIDKFTIKHQVNKHVWAKCKQMFIYFFKVTSNVLQAAQLLWTVEHCCPFLRNTSGGGEKELPTKLYSVLIMLSVFFKT